MIETGKLERPLLESSHGSLGLAPLASPGANSASAHALIDLANPLLNLLAPIRASEHHDAPERLREYLAAQVRRFQTQAQQQGIPIEIIIGARYCLCTVLDEAAALTAWGGGGVWSSHSLLVTFHNETWGGEKFFQLLARLVQEPHQNRMLMELQYYCLVLGFQGRYRVIANGHAQLEAVRARLLKLLRGIGPGYAAPLTSDWPALVSAAGSLKRRLPPWVWLTLAGLLGCVMYLVILAMLSRDADKLDTRMSELSLPQLDIVLAPRPASVPLAGALQALIQAGRISVVEHPDRSVVTIHGEGLFDSGSATLQPAQLPMLKQIAQALLGTSGPLQVVGYTDNQAIHTSAFSSNRALSERRAETVQQLLVSVLGSGRSISATGRGEADPVASNATASGRARNRRVEIVLLPHADAPKP